MTYYNYFFIGLMVFLLMILFCPSLRPKGHKRLGTLKGIDVFAG